MDTTTANPTNSQKLTPLNWIQRRIVGVLMEKAKMTPDSYPLTLNALVNGANQKSSRNPVSNLTPEQIEDQVIELRQKGIVAEVHGSGFVAKFRHMAYDFLGVKGIEASVMTELLLRGEQTAGELRTRASRFEPIDDLPAMHRILDSLTEKKLVVALTPSGRGQLFTHNLYLPDELEQLVKKCNLGLTAESTTGYSNAPASTISSKNTSNSIEVDALRSELNELRMLVARLEERIQILES